MVINRKKSDIVFIVGMTLVLIMHLWCIFGADHYADESFFPSIPLRLINGDSLVSDEWHVTQFSSLFLYVPVKLYLAVKGSTQGIILFLRFFYLAIHTSVSVFLYVYFRKYKLWAVAAVFMFYTQVPLRFLSVNYHSVFALFLLLLTIMLLNIYDKDKHYFYILAGICYGCCCICNPFQCILFFIYAIICLAWNIKNRVINKKDVNLHKNKAASQIEKSNLKSSVFGIRAFLYVFAGISIIAVISISFFFATGGTINGLIENIPNLLTDSAHNTFFSSPVISFVEKLGLTWEHFTAISFEMPFVLPVYYLVLFVDKKRRKENHKLVYVTLSLAISIFYTVGVTIGAIGNSRRLAMSLPFLVISSVCYILTENKNKKLFYCMWLPGVFAEFIQYAASNLHLSTFWVLTISNIAGVFFIKDFVKEVAGEKVKLNSVKSLRIGKLCFKILITGICLQLVFQCGIYMIGRTVKPKYEKLEEGPYAGLRLEQENLKRNEEIIADLDEIKRRSNEEDHVLILTEFTWMYLYIDRPFAAHTAWQPYFEPERLQKYYDYNPEKSPKYIYVCWLYISSGVSGGHTLSPESSQNRVDILRKMFDCKVEELSSGYLLTVK